MAIAGITITSARSQVVDFTIPYYMEPSAVLLKIKGTKRLFFLKPLSYGLLLLFVFLPFKLGFIVWTFEGLENVATNRMKWNNLKFTCTRLLDIFTCFAQRNFTSGKESCNFRSMSHWFFSCSHN